MLSQREPLGNRRTTQTNTLPLSDSGIRRVVTQQVPMPNLLVRFLPAIHVFNAEIMVYHSGHEGLWSFCHFRERFSL